MTPYEDQLYQKALRNAAKGDTRYQCLLHLIDLKRAGHSPKKTELSIPPQHAKFVMPEPVIRAGGWL